MKYKLILKPVSVDCLTEGSSCTPERHWYVIDTNFLKLLYVNS